LGGVEELLPRLVLAAEAAQRRLGRQKAAEHVDVEVGCGDLV